MRNRKIALGIMGIFLLLLTPVYCGQLDSPGDPALGSGVPTLEDLYDYLSSGTEWIDPESFQEPQAGPAPTMYSLVEIYDTIQTAFESCDAIAGQVLAGSTFFSTTGGNWGPTTGTLTNNGPGGTITPGTTDQTVAAGCWSSANTVSGDADLEEGNIRSGVEIFGVAGDSNVVDTSSGDAAAGDILSGKKAWVDGNEVTGTFECITCSGTLSAGGRWCDNGDGTVMDMTTRLVWLKDVTCASNKKWYDSQNDDAVTLSSVLYDGSTNYDGSDCGLSDGSTLGDWRLPTKNDLAGIFSGPERIRCTNYLCSESYFFDNLQMAYYWSSTTDASDPGKAICVFSGIDARTESASKSSINARHYLWPVRAAH